MPSRVRVLPWRAIVGWRSDRLRISPDTSSSSEVSFVDQLPWLQLNKRSGALWFGQTFDCDSFDGCLLSVEHSQIGWTTDGSGELDELS